MLDEDIDEDPIVINVSLPKILEEDLVKLGQYLTALTTIFPESKVEDILRTCLEAMGADDVDGILKAAAAQRKKIDADNAANMKLAMANAAAKSRPPAAGLPSNGKPAPAPQVALSKESIDALNHFADSLKEVMAT